MSPPGGSLPDAADLALLVPLLISSVAASVLAVAEWRASRPVLLRPLLALLPIVILGALLRLTSIESKAPWRDEALTAIRAAGFSESEVVSLARGGSWLADLTRFSRPMPGTLSLFLLHPARHNADVHPPLYFVLARLWQEVVAEGFVALRWLSALLGVLAIVAAAWLAKEVSDSAGAALLAAAALAASPLQVLYSQEARMYSLLVLLALASSAMLVRCLRAGGGRRVALYAALVGLGCLCHGLFGLVVAGQGLFLATLLRGPVRGRSGAALLAAAVAAAASALPWMLMAHARGRERGLNWLMEAPDALLWAKRLVAGLALCVGGFEPDRIGLAPLAVLALGLLAEIGRRRAAWGSALAVPAVVWLVTLLGVDLWKSSSLAAQPRYLLVPASLFLVLAATAFGNAPARWRSRALVAGSIAVVAVALAAARVASRPSHWIKGSAITPEFASALAQTPHPTLLLPTSEWQHGATLVAMAAGARTSVWVERWSPADEARPGSFVLSSVLDRESLEAKWHLVLEPVGPNVFRVGAASPR